MASLITQQWRHIGRWLLVNEIRPNATDPRAEGLCDRQSVSGTLDARAASEGFRTNQSRSRCYRQLGVTKRGVAGVGSSHVLPCVDITMDRGPWTVELAFGGFCEIQAQLVVTIVSMLKKHE